MNFCLQRRKKRISGLTGHLGWSEKWSTLAEVDRVTTQPKTGKEVVGYAIMQRTGYEIFKGFQALVLNDYYQRDKTDGSTKNYRYGPGLIWYPRPHLDFQLFYTKEQDTSLDKEGVYAWLMTHYYF